MASRRLVGLLVALNIALLAVIVAQRFHPAVPLVEVSGTPALAANAGMGSVLSLETPENPIVKAAKMNSPAVVAVGGTVSLLSYSVDPFFEGFFWPYFARPAEQHMEVPFVGSGVVINADGHVVTNVHVVQEVTDPFVTFSNGQRVSAKLLDKDNRVDVALLKADATKTTFSRMGDSSTLQPGEWVLAIGNPFGDVIPDPRPTVTLGVVSALHRNYKATDVQRERIYLDMIQTDAAINPGNSGGALVNIRGETVGINTFIVSRSGGSVGIGFAIPINRVKAVVNEILEHGHVRNFAMDFEVVDVTPRVAKQLRIPSRNRGAVVTAITDPKGAAVRAGLELGDIIIQTDQLPVRTANDLLNYFLSLQVGAQIQFKVIRDGKERTLNYAIEEYKAK